VARLDFPVGRKYASIVMLAISTKGRYHGHEPRGALVEKSISGRKCARGLGESDMNRWPWIVAVILAIVAIGQQVKVGKLSDANASLEQAASQATAKSVQTQASLDAATASAQAAKEAAASAASAAKQTTGELEQSLAEVTSQLATKEAALAAASASLSKAKAATSDAQAITSATRTKAQEAAAKLQEIAAEVGDLKQQLSAKDAEMQKIKAALQASRAAEKLATVAKTEAEHIAKATADAVQPAAVGAENQTPLWVPPVAGPLASPPARAVCMDCHTPE